MKKLRRTLTLFVGGFLFSSFTYAQSYIVKMTTTKDIGTPVAISVNHNSKAFTIDWGDGQQNTYQTDSNDMVYTIEGTVKGKVISVGGEDGWHMLNCSDCSLTQIDLSTAKNLTSLYCANNQLTTLDVRGMINLLDLDCSHNQIAKFVLTDVNAIDKDLASIENLNISYNQFSGAYLFKMPTLQHLKINNNAYNKFYIYDEKLKSLDCSNNQISGFLSLSMCKELQSVVCNGNAITTFTLADQGKNIQQIVCDDNLIKTLDLDKATALSDLLCTDNQLHTVTLAPQAMLSTLDAKDNSLTFSILPAKDKAPKFLAFEPQRPFDLSKAEGILTKDNVVYAPLAANWEDRNSTFINMNAFCVLNDNTNDADYQWYSVSTDGTETRMTECTTEANGDYAVDNGKFAFFKGHQKAYTKLTSKSYGFVIESTPIAIGDNLTAVEHINNDSQHLQIRVSHNSLILSSTTETGVKIFTIDGKNVWNGKVNGTIALPLPKGIYIVNNHKIIL